MSDFTQFDASIPIVKPATPEVVYNKYWLKRMSVNAPDPTGNVTLTAIFVPARDVTEEIDGVTVTYKELMPNGPEKELRIWDLFGVADGNGDFAKVIEGVFAALKAMATQQNIL
jgi:hypothetical protein